MSQYEDDSFESSSSNVTANEETLEEFHEESSPDGSTEKRLEKLRQEQEEEQLQQEELEEQEHHEQLQETHNHIYNNNNHHHTLSKDSNHHYQISRIATASLTHSESDSLTDEHKQAAEKAVERPEFQQLSTFVAFGSESEPSQERQKNWEFVSEQYKEEEEEEEEEKESEETKLLDKNLSFVSMTKRDAALPQYGVRNIHDRPISQERSDVEFSFLSTLEEHLLNNNDKKESDEIDSSTSQKESSNVANNNNKLTDLKQNENDNVLNIDYHTSNNTAHTFLDNETNTTHEDSKGREINKKNEQEELLLEEKTLTEKEREHVEENGDAESRKEHRQWENSVSPPAKEHGNTRFSKSVSFRLPSLPLPENIHIEANNNNIHEITSGVKEISVSEIPKQSQPTMRQTNMARVEEEHELKSEREEESEKLQQPRKLEQRWETNQLQLHFAETTARLSNNKGNGQSRPFLATPPPLPTTKSNHLRTNTRATSTTSERQRSTSNNDKADSYIRNRCQEDVVLETKDTNKEDERTMQKVTALRETSEAVERLVQSLAMLRGYNKLKQIGMTAPRLEQSEITSTLHSSQPSYSAKPTNITEFKRNTKETSAHDKTDAVLEEMVTELVLEMLSKEQKDEAITKNTPLTTSRQNREVVTAENFYHNNAQHRCKNNYNNNVSCSTANDEAKLISNKPYSYSNNYALLYENIISSIEKYVFKQVKTCALPEQTTKQHTNSSSNGVNNYKSSKTLRSTLPANGHSITQFTISPSFCMLLLIDLTLVCKQIADQQLLRSFVATSSSSSSSSSSLLLLEMIKQESLSNFESPLLIKYCGLSRKHYNMNIDNPINNSNCNDKKKANNAEHVSTNKREKTFVKTLIHCLPFEIIQPSTATENKETCSFMRSLTSAKRHNARGNIAHNAENELIFRLEYWITYREMQIIINALLACMRSLLSRYIESDQYFPLNRNVGIFSHIHNKKEHVLPSQQKWSLTEQQEEEEEEEKNNEEVENYIDPPIQREPYFALIASNHTANKSINEQIQHCHLANTQSETIQPQSTCHNRCFCKENRAGKNDSHMSKKQNLNTFNLELTSLQEFILSLSKMTTRFMEFNRSESKRMKELYQKERQQHESVTNKSRRKACHYDDATTEIPASVTASINVLAQDMSMDEQYTLYSSCVMETVKEHINDVHTNAAIRERVNEKYANELYKRQEAKYGKDGNNKTATLLREKEQAMILESEARAANVLEQIMQEINVLNLSSRLKEKIN